MCEQVSLRFSRSNSYSNIFMNMYLYYYGNMTCVVMSLNIRGVFELKRDSSSSSFNI